MGIDLFLRRFSKELPKMVGSMIGDLPRPQPHSGVLAIEAYVPGRSKAPGVSRVYKLSSNESPLGPSPRAIVAYREVAGQLQEYPDGAAGALKAAIGEAFDLDPNCIVCGAGIDDLLNLLADAYLTRGDEAIHTRHGFQMYSIVTRGSCATPVVAPERNYTADVDRILGLVTDKTKIVFIANPNNPTGTYLPFNEIRRLHRELPSNVLLVIDAAYAEYVCREDYRTGSELVAASDNVVMLRTFSKVYGLAALRLGWGYMPSHVVDALDRVRGPFNVNAAAMAAGIASLEDTDHVERSVVHNDRWRTWVSNELRKLGFMVTESAGNFVMIFFKDSETAIHADSFLTQRGLILRRLATHHLPNALRMTIGSEEANRLALSTLAEFSRTSA